MSPFAIFRKIAGLEGDPRDDETLWSDIRNSPGFVDSRDCGLVDAVQSGWYQSETNELFKGFPVTAEDIVLDIGCGAGGATMFCANRGAHVIFADVDADKISSLRHRVSKTIARRAEGHVISSEKLPFDSACMTRVIAMEVMEHVADPQGFMNELARVGAPGALYLLAVPDPVGERIQQTIAPASHFEPPNHIHIFEREQFGRIVSESGLEVVKRESYGFYWTMWMLFYWITIKANEVPLAGASHEFVQEPFYPVLNDWAKLWHQIIQLPAAAPVKAALDQLMPKSQVIIARKPDSNS